MRQVWIVFGSNGAGIDAVLSIHDSKAGAMKAAERETRRRDYARIQVVRRGVSMQRPTKEGGRDA